LLIIERNQGAKAGHYSNTEAYQGTIRHRGVIDGGALFGYFLGKQKVTYKI